MHPWGCRCWHDPATVPAGGNTVHTHRKGRDMGLFSRLRPGGSVAPGQPASGNAVVAEQAVIAQYQLAAGPTGTATDMYSLFTLEERLIEAIGAARAGEFDGNEFGPGEVTLYA